MGIEPTSEAWEASILPLYDARSEPYANKPAGWLQKFFIHLFVLECRIAEDGLAYRDLREFIANLEKEGELRRIAAEVDPVLEITEITDRVTRAGGPALLYERPKGSRVPLLINMLGSERRMNLALEVSYVDEVAARIRGFLVASLRRLIWNLALSRQRVGWIAPVGASELRRMIDAHAAKHE
jgi:hypothetical protein